MTFTDESIVGEGYMYIYTYIYTYMYIYKKGKMLVIAQ